ncbi:hypothetical protein [Aneurinibacillus thermoaerophilus]|uniref:Uncharacterized protein n=2 Tax=Aneurinibacillus thermoaerophilus TaxID=143495 RepID=A0A1G8A5U6_ANETH|nr:hypothetical protein [Aneurinibacillus thermoaerophilus]MED0675476.1 hypothetical protein [Aneurinibacillus thermoaerophilus]MED0678831.1 hypothetical protein [Aneurinibacillus thermoaerophilus]MED0736704.1 hypothetical protein [Aneurinibacillus thermoaerophilus]MED0758359.1 hypothetical protein [Aneurinibacillus thermoaerophilus]MED0759834.1 hypothetical protein [Aneurinibacillus thermoaerophilus]
MFDPTIYENIKVALEGAIYDFDFAGEILVTSRSDTVELASMSRTYTIGFSERHKKAEKGTTALLILSADAADLVGEILELPESEGRKFGCTLRVQFVMEITDIARCRRIEEELNAIWSHRPLIMQELAFRYEPLELDEPALYRNTVTLDFGRKINEDNIGDIYNIVEHTVHSLRRLD